MPITQEDLDRLNQEHQAEIETYTDHTKTLIVAMGQLAAPVMGDKRFPGFVRAHMCIIALGVVAGNIIGFCDDDDDNRLYSCLLDIVTKESAQLKTRLSEKDNKRRE